MTVSLQKTSFEAVILDPGGPGAYVEIPFDVEAAFGKKRVKICAEIEGQPYRGSIQRMGGERHILIIVKEIREKISKQIGDSVHITIWEDDQPRVVELPPELEDLFTAEPAVKTAFRAMAYSHQREYVLHINEAKQAETRKRRALKAVMQIKTKLGSS